MRILENARRKKKPAEGKKQNYLLIVLKSTHKEKGDS